MMRKLKKSLLKPAAYPEPTADVRLVETHVSYIFITNSFAYKVKKPVDFGFLNFTTLDRRRFYCEEEVRLNRRLCPEIYLGVVELRGTPEAPRFEGEGPLIDYAVKMKRLPDERMLDRMLERGELGESQLREIARVVAEFHLAAARGPQIDAQGSPAAIRANWEENFRQCAPFVPLTICRSDLNLIRHWVDVFLRERAELFEARVAGGFMRECDGDLHLGNICLIDRPAPRLRPASRPGADGQDEAQGPPGDKSRVCIFDCIEFNERFRFSDTAADVAFLLMDLEYAGRPDLCQPFLETYQEVTGDSGLTEMLDFYRSYRAFVRGKVISMRIAESGVPAAEFEAGRVAASRYFRLARGYCLRDRVERSLVVTCGMMGTGKSSLARELSRELGFTLISSDRVRKSLAGLPPTSRAQAGYQEGIYTPAATQATYQSLREEARRELAAGRSVVVDASCKLASDREAFRMLAAELGARFSLVHTDCSRKLIKERLERRRLDPDEVSDGRWELIPEQLAAFEMPGRDEAIGIDTSRPLAEGINQLLKAMGVLP
jgi:aminoglycoside phosphotransferase family enzyme/predicted kinase